MSGNLNLSLIVKMVDGATAPLRRLNNQIEAMQAPVRRFSQEFNRSLQVAGIHRMREGVAGITREVAGLTLKLTAMAGAMGFVFKTQFVDTAAQFERFNAVLEVLEGSSAKAKKSMAWINDFATTTPYNVGEVTDAFVKLRSYGLDPTKGLLKTLGDTASAMGKPLDQAVEAIADAVNGENERLKELGITSSVKGKKTAYSFVEDGKTITKTVDNTNKRAIQSTLEAIWNRKFAGAMEKRSKTWEGLASNLDDQWTRIKLAVMDAGLFAWMKTQLEGVLNLVNRMAADGSLQAWAEDAAAKIKTGFETILQVGKEVGTFVSELADKVGGFGNLAKLALGGVALIMVGPLLAAIANTTLAVAALMLAFSANPAIAAITLISAAIALWRTNFDDIVSGAKLIWSDFTDWLSEMFTGAIKTIDGSLEALKDGFMGIVRGLNPFGASQPLFPNIAPTGPKVEPLSGNKNQVNGKIDVSFKGPFKIDNVQSDNPKVPLDVSNGLNLMSAY